MFIRILQCLEEVRHSSSSGSTRFEVFDYRSSDEVCLFEIKCEAVTPRPFSPLQATDLFYSRFIPPLQLENVFR